MNTKRFCIEKRPAILQRHGPFCAARRHTPGCACKMGKEAGRRYMKALDSQDELLQVALDYHVLYRAHGNLEQVGVGRIGKVAINLLFGVPVQRPEFVHEVFAGLLPIIDGALVVDKAVAGNGTYRDLLLEEIHLVEEEDEGRFGEPVRVGDGLPQHQGFVHLVLPVAVSDCRPHVALIDLHRLYPPPSTGRSR